MAKLFINKDIVADSDKMENWYLTGVDGMSFSDVQDFLGWVAPDDNHIDIELHSCGGDVAEGYAIYDALRATGKEISATVVGRCASMATVILLAAPIERRKMYPHAKILIHSPFCPGIEGSLDISALESLKAGLEAERERMLSLYVERCGVDRSLLEEQMAKETWFGGEIAKQLGFVSEVIMPKSAKVSTKTIIMSKENEMTVKKSLFERILAKAGYETIIINNNPETVSTDFDIADKLYFEPLTPEDVENVVNIEKPDGAVVQFGGQTAIKLTESLMKMGVPILGTKAEDVDAAEDRELFDEILEQTQIPRAAGGTVFTAEEAKEVANRLGYPVLVRPSYVLGGQGMQIAGCDEEIEEFMAIINRIAQDHPILVDKYLQGKELEVDAVCDGTDILIPGIMEHIERTGVHSGDSISVYPAHTVSRHVKETIAEYTRRLAKALHVKGLINIQFIAVGEEVYVIEVNPRSSRTVPYISKVTGIPIVDLATEVIIGKTIKELGYEPGLQKEAEYIAIKMPVFSFEKIRGAEISLGPEMKSTGECLGIAKTFNEALYKAFLGAGIDLPKHKQMIITVKDADKGEAIEIGRRFEKLGYTIYATRSTAKALNDAGVKARKVNKINQESPTVMDLILGHKIDLVIDTPTQGRDKSRDGFLIRRTSIETGVNCLTAMDTAKALATSLENKNDNPLTLVNIAEI